MIETPHKSSKLLDYYQPLFNPRRGIQKSFVLFFILSILFHICLIAGGIGASIFQGHEPVINNFVQVDLVSPNPAPASDKRPPVAKKIITQEKPEKTEPESTEPEIIEPEIIEPQTSVPSTAQEPEIIPPASIAKNPEPNSEQPTIIRPDISLKSKPKNIDKLLVKKEKPAKKTVKKLQEKPDTQKILSRARKRLADKLKTQEKNNQKQIAQAIERMNQKVKSRPKSNASGATGPDTGTQNAGTGKKADALDIYKMVLSSAIRQNWIFNENMTKINQGIEVRLLIKILQSGEIRDIIYESRSGNHYLDDSAKKAIQRSNPLPPLPNAMKAYDVGVIFTPKGLQ